MPRVVLWSALGLGCGLLVFATSQWMSVALLAMLLSGFSVFRLLAGSNTLIQSLIDDQYRGRVMALFSMMAVGMLPVGHLAAGAAAQAIGARWTVAAGGLLCMVAGALWIPGRQEEKQA